MLRLLSYPRSIFSGFFAAFWTLVSSVAVILSVVLTGQRQKAAFATSKFWAKTILIVTGVDVELRGKENLPSEGCLYLFNHTSHYDILVMLSESPRLCYFGAKTELLSIPVFGRAIRRAGALPIERKNRAKVMQIYRDAEKRVREGDVFALAPEGTRTAGFGALGDFKSGPFYFSVNSQMPIVPVVLIGCEKVLPKHKLFPNWGIWRQTVIFEILPPIYPQGSDEAQIPQLKETVRTVMQKRLDHYWKA